MDVTDRLDDFVFRSDMTHLRGQRWLMQFDIDDHIDTVICIQEGIDQMAKGMGTAANEVFARIRKQLDTTR